MYYTYALVDSRQPGDYSFEDCELMWKPFYIGKGKKNRPPQHFWESALRGDNPVKENKIRGLLKVGIEPKECIIFLREFENAAEALLYERVLIKHFGKTIDGTGILLNLTDGGDNYPGRTFTAATRKKMSEVRKGRKLSEEHKKKIALARARQGPVSIETRTKRSKTCKGKINIKRYKLTSPKGKTYITKNGLSAFCREHRLSYHSFTSYLGGRRSTCNGGWKIEKLK